MASSDDETRAALWRDQQRRRIAFQQRLWVDLAGDPAAIARLRAKSAPLVDALAEAHEPAISPDEEFDPMGMSDTVNVGRTEQ